MATLSKQKPDSEQEQGMSMAGKVATGAAAIGIASVLAMYLRERAGGDWSPKFLASRNPKRPALKKRSIRDNSWLAGIRNKASGVLENGPGITNVGP